MRGLGVRTCLWVPVLLAAGCVVIASSAVTARSDTLEWALVQAYQNNPSLNAQRASLRAADENVPQALSGYRPKLSVTASGGFNYFDQLTKTVNQQVFPHQVFYTSLGSDLRLANSAPPRRKRSTTDSKPPTERAKRKAKLRAHARHCASPSNKSFSTPLPLT